MWLDYGEDDGGTGTEPAKIITIAITRSSLCSRPLPTLARRVGKLLLLELPWHRDAKARQGSKAGGITKQQGFNFWWSARDCRCILFRAEAHYAARQGPCRMSPGALAGVKHDVPL